jgi:hypothetical protein
VDDLAEFCEWHVEVVRRFARERGLRLVEFKIHEPRELLAAFPEIDAACWGRTNTQADNPKL